MSISSGEEPRMTTRSRTQERIARKGGLLGLNSWQINIVHTTQGGDTPHPKNPPPLRTSSRAPQQNTKNTATPQSRSHTAEPSRQGNRWTARARCPHSRHVIRITEHYVRQRQCPSIRLKRTHLATRCVRCTLGKCLTK